MVRDIIASCVAYRVQYIMEVNLVARDKDLLQDVLTGKQIKAKAYGQYASSVADPKIRQLFEQIQGVEERHINDIQQALNNLSPAQL